MGVMFLIEVHNAPAKIGKTMAFKRAFEAGIGRLLFNYHVANDREGTEIQYCINRAPKGFKSKKIDILFCKEDGKGAFDPPERKLMTEIASLLEELVNEQGRDKYLVEELS